MSNSPHDHDPRNADRPWRSFRLSPANEPEYEDIIEGRGVTLEEAVETAVEIIRKRAAIERRYAAAEGVPPEPPADQVIRENGCVVCRVLAADVLEQAAAEA
jgi:hypothetical protein